MSNFRANSNTRIARQILRGTVAAVLVVTATSAAQAQLFGDRTLGQPLSRRPKPGTEVGAATGSERYIRGNRSATDFVGSDSRDPTTFVGASQGTTQGRVPTAVENLRRRDFNAARVNPMFPQRQPRQMYTPRYQLGFDAPQRPSAATLARLSQVLQTTDGRFDSVEVQVNDRTATLRGVVGSTAEKGQAEALVHFEPGITDVRNELVVNPAVAPPPSIPIDRLRGR